VWTRGLAAWYTAHGRHHLPWRQTRDPWAVLVSEVMLQQTQVSRVLPRWQAFLDRWSDPASFAAAGRDDVLRFWQGLGYPRRVAALQQTASAVTRSGWPGTETGLRGLPGVGSYTARALLTLAFETQCVPPADVNLRRVAARAALGLAPDAATPAEIDDALEAGKPRIMARRDYTLALFDVGAIHCRSTPRCTGCPLRATCRSAGLPSAPPARRQAPYAGSARRLRGALLRVLLDEPGAGIAELHARVAGIPAATAPGAVDAALAGLFRDGLITAVPQGPAAN